MDAQPRLRLIGHLYRQTLIGVSDALRLTGAAPLTAAEKERLYGGVETAVWALPEAIMRGADADEWETLAGDDPQVREALEKVVEEVLEPRRVAAGN